MPDEPDNLVLVLLRELRSKIDGFEKRFDAIDKRFDDMRRDHGELRTWVQFAIGQGVTNQLKSSELEARIVALEKLDPQNRSP